MTETPTTCGEAHGKVLAELEECKRRLDNGKLEVKELTKSLNELKLWVAGVLVSTLASLVVGLTILLLKGGT